jgi:hypothetical protein
VIDPVLTGLQMDDMAPSPEETWILRTAQGPCCLVIFLELFGGFFFIFLKQNRKNVQAFAVPQKIWKL